MICDGQRVDHVRGVALASHQQHSLNSLQFVKSLLAEARMFFQGRAIATQHGIDGTGSAMDSIA